jgi:hypothetical protein
MKDYSLKRDVKAMKKNLQGAQNEKQYEYL